MTHVGYMYIRMMKNVIPAVFILMCIVAGAYPINKATYTTQIHDEKITQLTQRIEKMEKTLANLESTNSQMK
jgi:hypothetical protein